MARESRYALRLPPDLYSEVKTRAESAGVSMNELIIRCITEHLGIVDDKTRRLTNLQERGLITLEERVTAIEQLLHSEGLPIAPGRTGTG